MKSDFIDIEHFYAARIKSFELEREEITNYIHLIGPQQNELHILHWQGRQLLSTTTNVRVRYSKQHSKFEETLWQSQESKSELHAISHNDTASDLMIQQLSELSRPLQHDITYFFDDKFTSLNSNDRKSRLSLRNPDFSKVTSKKPNSGVLKQPKTGEVMLLEANLDATTEKLMTQFDSVIYQIQGLEAEMLQTEVDKGDILRPVILDATELISERNKCSHQCFLSVLELLKLRLRVLVVQREDVEQYASLTEEKISFAANLTQSSLQLNREIKQIRNKLVNDKRIRKIDFADQLKAISSQCAQFDRVEQLLSKDKKKMKSSQKIEKLESEVLYVQNRYQYEKLRRRNILEMEGYNNEAVMLRLRLSHIERVYASRQRQGKIQQGRNKSKRNEVQDPSRSPDVSPISDSIGFSDRWT